MARVRSLDRIDHLILAALRDDARMTNHTLAERVGLSARPCLERVRRLRASGVIQGFTLLLDPRAIGDAVIAIASITLQPNAAARKLGLERFLCDHPAVLELQVVSGSVDYLARIATRSLDAYEALTAEWLANRDFGIAHINTAFALKTLKAFRGYPPAVVAET